MLENFFQKYGIAPDDILIIACSGGPDSMCMLSEVLAIHPKERLIIAHFNHCLRGQESDGDEEFLRDFCAKNTLTFENIGKDIAAVARETKR